jgi:RNA polymerase sigma-70 factor (ECF subfamily)
VALFVVSDRKPDAKTSDSPPRPGHASASDATRLAQLAAAGDTAATARLLRLVAPEMARVVRGVMGPYASDVDDAVQQALIALIHALPNFRAECAPAGYACRIAFRTALSVRRRARTLRARFSPAEDSEPAGDGATPFQHSDAQRRTELVRSLLDEIPPEQAEALAMRTMLGWSLEEIAEASGSPLNTIRSRLRLAKEALRRKIEADPSLAEELGVAP